MEPLSHEVASVASEDVVDLAVFPGLRLATSVVDRTTSPGIARLRP